MTPKTRDLYKTVATKIHFYRKKMGYSQERLAEEVGVTRASIANMEKGRQRIAVDQIYSIAQACFVPPSFFLPGVEKKSNESAAKINKAIEQQIENKLPADSAKRILRKLRNITL